MADARRGTFSEELIGRLPDELRDAYALDDLLAADYRGRLVWLLRTTTGYLWGDFVGDWFADAVLASWQVVLPGPADTWA